MGRAPCCEKIGLKKGPWTPEEDQKLTSYIRENGHESWRVLPKKAGLLRCGKSCRLRWTNYLRPDIKRGEFSPNEEQTIIQLHALLGNKWSAIATQLPKRTDNEIKNYWNTNLRKKLLKMGFDPITHKPNTESTSCNSNLLESPSHSNSSSSVIHMVQWETVRLEAEARLARESKMRAKGLWPPSAPTRPWSSQQASCHVPSSQLEDGDLMSFEQDYKCLMAPLKQIAASEQENSSCTALQNSVELMSTLQNWEKYLQSQAGLMWPDSWGFSNLSSSVEGRESSSCTSPVYKLNHGSPTSSLCSLDQSSKQQLDIQYSTSSQATKISWTNNLLPNPHNPLNSSNDFFKPLPSTKPSQLGDGLQAVSDKISGDISLSSLPSLLQDLIQFDGFSMKRDDDSIVSSTLALDSATDSSRLFGEIDLVSEDICSARSSSAAAGASENHQISYSALLSEEYADCYWNNVLKEVVDSPMQEKIESNESNTIQNNSTIKTFNCSI